MGGEREVWLPVEDMPAWVRAVTTTDPAGGTVTLKRKDNGSEVTLPALPPARPPTRPARPPAATPSPTTR